MLQQLLFSQVRKRWSNNGQSQYFSKRMFYVNLLRCVSLSWESSKILIVFIVFILTSQCSENHEIQPYFHKIWKTLSCPGLESAHCVMAVTGEGQHCQLGNANGGPSPSQCPGRGLLLQRGQRIVPWWLVVSWW